MLKPFVRVLPAAVGVLLASAPGCVSQPPPAERGAVAAAQPAPRLTDAGPVDAEWLRRHYTKREVMIPMRDGVRLFTAVYEPRFTAERYPILMVRTPYRAAPYGPREFKSLLGPQPGYDRNGYIFVFQDVRGKHMSEGDFVNMTPHEPDRRTGVVTNESTDTYDTIEWLLSDIENHNGRVGQWGISYPGFYAAAGMIDAHPALVAVSPQAPIADWWYDDFHHHGAFFLPHAFHFLSSFGLPREGPTTERSARRFEYPADDAYDFYLNHAPTLADLNGPRYLNGEVPFWNDLAAHPNRDEFWEARDIIPHLDRTADHSLIVGGWFDAEDLYGPLEIYKAVERNNPSIDNKLVMGPWRHGGWRRGSGESLGDARFANGVSAFYQKHVELPWFERHLRPEDPRAPFIDLPEATVYETGRDIWRAFDAWPPPEAVARNLWLSPGSNAATGGAGFGHRAPEDARAIEFISDPADPVPYTRERSIRMVATYMTEDQRHLRGRGDVLTFSTPVLDEPLTVAGPITARLWVSTTGEDSDWIVKIIDEHPGGDSRAASDAVGNGPGYQMLVRSETIRGRFRNDPANPQPFTPGEPALIELPLQDVLHTFQPGHRLVVQVHSTWFPLIDRNPQSWVDNIWNAALEDFEAHTHRLHTGGERASSVELPVVRQSDLPPAWNPVAPAER